MKARASEFKKFFDAGQAQDLVEAGLCSWVVVLPFRLLTSRPPIPDNQSFRNFDIRTVEVDPACKWIEAGTAPTPGYSFLTLRPHGDHAHATTDPRMAAADFGSGPRHGHLCAALAMVDRRRNYRRRPVVAVDAGAPRPAAAGAGADRLLFCLHLGRVHLAQPVSGVLAATACLPPWP